MDWYENLYIAATENKWKVFSSLLDEIQIHKLGKLDKCQLAKLVDILTTPDVDISVLNKSVLLDIIVNSLNYFMVPQCLSAAKFAKELETVEQNCPGCMKKNHVDLIEGLYSCPKNKEHWTNINNDEMLPDYSNDMYACLSEYTDDIDEDADFFPYSGVVEWSVHYIMNYIKNDKYSYKEHCLLKSCMNFVAEYAMSGCQYDLPPCLKSKDFKETIIYLITSYRPLVTASVKYILHMFEQKLEQESGYTQAELCTITNSLLAMAEEYDCSTKLLDILLRKQGWLSNCYGDFSIEHKCLVLRMINRYVEELLNCVQDETSTTEFYVEDLQFLSERFKTRSDLILTTVNSCSYTSEMKEATLLLNIIDNVAMNNDLCHILQSDNNLIINCISLFESLYAVAKAVRDDCIQVQKEPSTKETQADQEYSAFDFTIILIRVIGNLAEEHEINQTLIREMNVIPLLIECYHFYASNERIISQHHHIVGEVISTLNYVFTSFQKNKEIILKCCAHCLGGDRILGHLNWLSKNE